MLNKEHQLWMMISYKAMNMELNEEVPQQLLRYNQSVPVAFLVITNGSYTYAYEKTSSNLKLLTALPDF